jgi:2-polyprenyl-3-methyl-5-hydroxy-6-metoxy-1,4-benzoquinol methylase
MGFLNKLGIAISGVPVRDSAQAVPDARRRHNGNGNSYGIAPASGPARDPEPHSITRVSNSLKDFLWNLEGIGRGTLLDMGPASQTTLSFFIDRGFRVTSEDILRGWVEFQAKDALRSKESHTAENYAERTPEALAKKFLNDNLTYGPSSFDALLLWDILDYTEPTLGKLMIAHVTEMLRPGGVVLALFHSKKPEGFQRYRVVDTNTLQVLSAKTIVPAQKVFQNREIQDLFGRFRTMKSYIGRDQLRETLFLK